jgi:hypothetical protein
LHGDQEGEDHFQVWNAFDGQPKLIAETLPALARIDRPEPDSVSLQKAPYLPFDLHPNAD